MSITRVGFIGPALNGVGSPATFTTDTLVTANTALAAKMIVFRGWAASSSGGNTMTAELSSAQPTFTSACFNPVGGTACYGTVPIYPLSNARAQDNAPSAVGFFFVSVVIPLVDVAIGATFSLTPTFGAASKIFAVGELYTGAVWTPSAVGGSVYAGTNGQSGGTVDTGYIALTMVNTISVPADSSMALTFQYTDTSTTCCLKCGSINGLFQSGDALADGAWDAGSTDVTWADTFGTVYTSCRDCLGYSPNRDRDYQVLLGHDTVTPSGSYTLTGTASMPNVGNQCLLGSATVDTRPRTGQRQTVILLRDHDPLECCPVTPPPQVELEGLVFFGQGDPAMEPGSDPPTLTTDAAMGQLKFQRGP